MATESELERKLREASTAVQDVELYRYVTTKISGGMNS
jgi:uncharacterized protein YgfB (UPF0149 family)